MAYVKQIWADGAVGDTPISAARLGYIEDGIGSAATVADQASSAASAAQTSANTAQTSAGAAQTSANTAQTTADAAQVDANTAQTSANTAQAAIDAVEATHGLPLDGFAGVTDDDKLTAALTYAAAQTYPPAIRLGNRQYDFSVFNREPFTGMKIIGPAGYSNPELNSQTKMAARVRLTGFTGGWFHGINTTTKYASVTFANLAFTGGSGCTVLTNAANASGFLCLLMRDISSSGLRSILGTQAQKVLLQAGMLDGGAWEINNCYNGAFHVGGSDCTFFPQGALIDSAVAFNTSGSANGQYHFWADYLSKSFMGPIYMTAEGPWNGILVTGPSSDNTGSQTDGVLTLTGARIEGRNPGAPCNGNLIRVDGGQLLMDRCWVSYGMGSPASTGHTPQDAGTIHQQGGVLDMQSCVYDRATALAETVPYVYANGGLAIVKRTKKSSRGGTWTGVPRVQDAAGTVDADSYVTVFV